MVIITFDDALLNTYEVAFPIMEKYGFKGVCFVPTGLFVGAIKSCRIDDAKYMTIEQLWKLHEAGWEIGSHSHSHVRFDKQPLSFVRWELMISKTYLDNWRFKPVSFAFPYGYGYYTKEQIDLAHEFYEYVRTVEDFDNKQPGLIHGVSIDFNTTPTIPQLAADSVVVIHLIRKLHFENWVSTLKNVCTFKDLEEKAKHGIV